MDMKTAVTVNVTLSSRPYTVRDIEKVVGDFTTNILFDFSASDMKGTIAEQLKFIRNKLYEYCDHSSYEGVEIIRDMIKTGKISQEKPLPIVFTSMLFRNLPNLPEMDVVYSQSQTSQVSLDNQTYKLEDGGLIVWDFIKKIYPETMVEEMFSYYCMVIEQLSKNNGELKCSPAFEKKIKLYNSTEKEIDFFNLGKRLDNIFYKFADKIAITDFEGGITYRELERNIKSTMHDLKKNGIKPGKYVVIKTDKSKESSLLNKNTILFVHGAYHAAWCWEEHFIPFFYAHGYNVYAMSFRNHGNSERIENVDQIVVKDMVEDLIKTIDMIDGKIILIAHSLGCRIAQMCLEEIYSSIQSVVLITPMPVRNNFLQLLQMSKKQRKNNLEYILFSERLDSERKEYYMSLLDKESKKVEYAMMKRQKKFSIYVRKIPTLVIGSYNDQCVILQAVKDNAKIHTAELKIVDSVCHDMMLDPDWRNIADLIFKFIEKTIDKKSGDNYNDNYVSTQAHQGGE